MLMTEIKLLILKQEDFMDEVLETGADLVEKLRPEYVDAFLTADIVFIGHICLKNRFGNIINGSPSFD